MKKALIFLMLALSLATFAQNAPRAIVLDVFNKGGKVRQSTLDEVKTNLAQAISSHRGYEGIVNDKVDRWLLAEGFAEHPNLSKEQATKVAILAEVPYALLSEATNDNYGYLNVTILLVDLDNYQVMTKETLQMDNKSDKITKGCEALINKIIPKLPEPPKSVVENEKESDNQSATSEEAIVITESMQPRPLTSHEAEEVARHLNRADVCIEMNYIDNAIKEYDEIIKMVPFWPNAYMYLANAYSLKNDEESLAKAMKNYKVFMQMTDDKELYYEAQDKLSRMEMMSELKAAEVEKVENFVGTWRTDLHDKYTGQPFFIFDISKTPVPNRFEIKLSPKSLMYSNIVNTKAFVDVIDNQITFSYTSQETYIPSQSKYNAAGAAVNYLFGNSLVGSVGGVLVESLREGDVGYTNIMDFEFNADVNVQSVQDELYQVYGNEYMDGSCHMKGEHHQAGRSVVNLDTIYGGGFYKGDENYPVFIKVTEFGGNYYYGDIKLGGKNNIIDYSPYISRKEYEDGIRGCKTGFVVSGVFLSASGGLLLAGLLFNGVNKVLGDPAFFGKTFFVTTGVISGASLIGCIIANGQKNSFMKELYSKHNQQIDENIRKFSQRDQANVSVNVGLTPMGVGVSMNF